ncbi:MAG: GAF domain-containing protein [Leptolyngbyaceae cyanobacterium MO_188.B28]|nr:GAF domain-containing protein [Leptolyngbyaceae cyanobacterium MO_188.B28]
MSLNQHFLLEQIIYRHPLVVAPETPLAEVIDLMSQSLLRICRLTEDGEPLDDNPVDRLSLSCVLVMADIQLLGIFTERDMVRLVAVGGNLAGLTVADVMTRPVITLKAIDAHNVFHALNLMRQHQIRHLPIVDEQDQLLGIVTPEGVRRTLQPTDLLRLRQVGEVMSTQVIHASSRASVLQAAQLMAQHQVSCVVIVESTERRRRRSTAQPANPPTQNPKFIDEQSEASRRVSQNSFSLIPIGIITERDIVQFQKLELDLTRLQTQTVMSAPLFPVRLEDSLWAAHQQMQQHRVRRLVVTGPQGGLRGIVTQTSLLQALDPVEMHRVLELLQHKVKQLEAENIQLLQSRTTELERQVQDRTAELQQQVDQERVVTETAQHIRRPLDLEEILTTATAEVRTFLQTDRVIIYRFEPDWSGIAIAESVATEWPSILGATIKESFFEETANRQLYEEGRIQATSDIYTAGISPCHLDFLEQFQVKANLVVPILRGERLWGLFAAQHCAAPRRWKQLDIDLLRRLATQMEIALRQAELYQQVQAELTERQQAEETLRFRAYRQSMIAELGKNGLANNNLADLMNEAVAMLAHTLEVEYCKILELLPEQNVLLLRAGVGWRAGLIGEALVETHRGSQAGYTLLSSEPVVVSDLRTETRFNGPSLLVDHQVVSGVSVVIQGEDRPFGVLGVHTTQRRIFSSDDVNFLQTIAHVLSNAINRKQTEQKIREQAALLDVATDAICVRGIENQILFWNQGAERLYGWTADEALGKDANQLLYRNLSPQLGEIQQALAEKGEWQGELSQVTKADQDIIVESRWTWVRDDAGDPKSTLIVNTDVTEKKQLEAQFLRAQRLESLGVLAGGIAHDLNNILTPILASTKLLPLRFPNADPQSQRLFEMLKISAERGAALVKQVLSFSRGVEGEYVVLQVRHLISEIKQIAEETFPKSIELHTNIPRDLWPIHGDATHLHQVLMNLCINARDAMPNGGVLSISAENLLSDQHFAQRNLEAQVGPYILITISDTGNGISHDILDRIFDPFFTTKEVGQGTGLGLSTVMGIVKKHGGFVAVHSEVGQGSQFRVYLPTVETPEVLQVEDSEPLTGQGEWVLIVDDEALIREMAKTSLETYNYKVLTAKGGIEAIALYAQHKDEIKAVLMDMMMPTMDGVATIRTLQKINPQVQIIAVSGLTASDQLTAAMAIGVDTFLPKPYTSDALLNILHEALNGQ